MVTVFKEKLNELPPIFYSSIGFVFETAFILEQIAGSRFGALLVISDKFITKLNVFSYIWFCSSGLKQFGKFQNHTVWLLKQWLGSFTWKVRVCTTKVRNELLKMGIDLKIKHSVSSLIYKVWRNYFHKKALHRGRNFFGQIFLGMLYMGTNDKIMQGGKLMVKRSQRSIQVSFSPYWPWPGLLIFEKLTPQIEG